MFQWYCKNKFFWFRISNHAFKAKYTPIHKIINGETNVYTKYVILGGWLLAYTHITK